MILILLYVFLNFLFEFCMHKTISKPRSQILIILGYLKLKYVKKSIRLNIFLKSAKAFNSFLRLFSPKNIEQDKIDFWYLELKITLLEKKTQV